MKKIAIVLAGALALLVAWLIAAFIVSDPSTETVLTNLSLYLVFAGAVIAYYQTQIRLNQKKRKAATDFIFEEVTQVLQPLEEELKEMLDKDFLVFCEDEDYEMLLERDDLSDQEKQRVKELVGKILNFYERMAIGIFKGALDEDICYDDKGFLMISFYDWTANHIKTIRKNIEDRAYANGVGLAQKWSERYQEHAERIREAKRKRDMIATIDNKEIA